MQLAVAVISGFPSFSCESSSRVHSKELMIPRQGKDTDGEGL
jgi:hypothetical protein